MWILLPSGVIHPDSLGPGSDREAEWKPCLIPRALIGSHWRRNLRDLLGVAATCSSKEHSDVFRRRLLYSKVRVCRFLVHCGDCRS